MADASKFKRRRTSLVTPPPLEEASTNLSEPEAAPSSLDDNANQLITPPRIDGRSRRRSNRTLQLNLRITPECDALLRHIADQENILLTEALERSVNSYAKKIAIK